MEMEMIAFTVPSTVLIPPKTKQELIFSITDSRYELI